MAAEFSERPREIRPPADAPNSGESLSSIHQDQGIGALAGTESPAFLHGVNAPMQGIIVSEVPYNHDMPLFDEPRRSDIQIIPLEGLESAVEIPLFEAQNGEDDTRAAIPSDLPPTEGPSAEADQPAHAAVHPEGEESFDLTTVSLPEALERFDPEGEITLRQRENLEQAQAVLSEVLGRDVSVRDMISTVQQVWIAEHPEEESPALTERQSLTAFAELSPRQQEIALLRFEEGRTVASIARDRALKAPGISKQIGIIREKVRTVAAGEVVAFSENKADVLRRVQEVKALIDQGLTTPRQIADALGEESTSRVNKDLRRVAAEYGPDSIASVSIGKKTTRPIRSLIDQIRPFVNEGIRSAPELAERIGGEVTHDQIYGAMRVMRERGELAPRQTSEQKLAEIYRLYTTEHLTRVQIAERLGIPKPTIYRLFRQIEQGWTPPTGEGE